MIREREKEIKHEVDKEIKENKEETLKFTKMDIIAMIIAAYQLIMPIILILAVILIYLLMFK